jgi:hypothetical protein
MTAALNRFLSLCCTLHPSKPISPLFSIIQLWLYC